MDLTLKIWRQKNSRQNGNMETHNVTSVSPDMSFLEMLDELNEKLLKEGKEPVAFESDCREGICGACSLVINGTPHGPEIATTTCQLHMRKFSDGETITIEPWLAKPFPVLKDLIVDRMPFDRIMQAGGFVSANTGGVPDANAMLISKIQADEAMDAAACIGCGACVAACKNASAMLFVSAKVGQFSALPQGQPERYTRVLKMVDQMDVEGFGSCTNTYDCEAACPKEISVKFIAKMNRDYLKATLFSE